MPKATEAEMNDEISTQLADLGVPLAVRSEAGHIFTEKESWWHGKNLKTWAPVLLELLYAFRQDGTPFFYTGEIYDIINSEFRDRFRGFLTFKEPSEIYKAHLGMLFKQHIKNPLDKTFVAFLLRAISPNDYDRLRRRLANFTSWKQKKSPSAWGPAFYRYLCGKKSVLVSEQLQEKAEKLFRPAYLCLERQHLLTRLHRIKDREESRRKAAEESRENRLLRADSDRNGYPPLDENLLRDPLRGHWDLWPGDGTGQGQEKQVIAVEDGLMARNPAGDIQNRVPVCIDFGTSSTVVALRENGRRRLLRVGVSDWKEAAASAHFENPTALEFISAADTAKVWAEEEWRPHVRWASLKCSHQAKNDISPLARPETLFSIIGDLKTWARCAAHQPPLDMRDQQGEALRLTADAAGDWSAEEGAPPALNPLELYAFHLGLAINNQYRDNGRIYHEYYLSFPATFDSATRRRILSAFARGLERSLPASLGLQR